MGQYDGYRPIVIYFIIIDSYNKIKMKWTIIIIHFDTYHINLISQIGVYLINQIIFIIRKT